MWQGICHQYFHAPFNNFVYLALPTIYHMLAMTKYMNELRVWKRAVTHARHKKEPDCQFIELGLNSLMKYERVLVPKWTDIMRQCFRTLFHSCMALDTVSGCRVLDLDKSFLFGKAPIQGNGMNSSSCCPWLQLLKMGMPKFLISGHWLSSIVGFLQFPGVTGGVRGSVYHGCFVVLLEPFTDLTLGR